MTQQLQVHLGENSYSIRIQKGLLQELGFHIAKDYTGHRIFVVTDDTVLSLYGDLLKKTLERAGFHPFLFSLKPGESSKNMESLEQIYDAMLAFGMQRTDLLLAFGGGVVGDVGGFAAATFLRGIPFMVIPTTLLAQVDSSVGGKVAINLPQGKNLIGSFYQPKAVWIDPLLLETLPPRIFWDGLAEVIKYGCVFDEALFSILETCTNRKDLMANMDQIVWNCCHLKSCVVEQDPLDQGRRMLLNFGHTLGHALETASGYRLRHGEGVAIGMAQITKISEQKGLTEEGTTERMEALLHQWNLPVTWDGCHQDAIKNALWYDKKNRQDHLTVVVLAKIGTGLFYDTDQTFFKEVLDE